jgi:hypothetical protein
LMRRVILRAVIHCGVIVFLRQGRGSDEYG